MAIMPAPTSTAVNLGAETKKMVSVSGEEGAQRIMALSINLYADPNSRGDPRVHQNAVDTTILGDRCRRQRHSPTRLNPVLTITDFGAGMSAEELENNFLMFAASTKIDTNDQVGCLGGREVRMDYRGVIHHRHRSERKRNMVRASRTLTHDVLLDNVDTDAPNGTTISIPLTRLSANWNEVIYTVSSAHAQGAVTIDGATVESIQSRNWIGPISSAEEMGTMWSRRFSAEARFFFRPPVGTGSSTWSSSLVPCTVPLFGWMSAPDFTPSRESLIDRPQRTCETLHAAARVLHSNRDNIQMELDELVEAGKFPRRCSAPRRGSERTHEHPDAFIRTPRAFPKRSDPAPLP